MYYYYGHYIIPSQYVPNLLVLNLTVLNSDDSVGYEVLKNTSDETILRILSHDVTNMLPSFLESLGRFHFLSKDFKSDLGEILAVGYTVDQDINNLVGWAKFRNIENKIEVTITWFSLSLIKVEYNLGLYEYILNYIDKNKNKIIYYFDFNEYIKNPEIISINDSEEPEAPGAESIGTTTSFVSYSDNDSGDGVEPFRMHNLEPNTLINNLRETGDGRPSSINLFFGTTRGIGNIEDKENYFTGSFDSDSQITLRKGVCRVTIPPNHKKENIERPKSFLWWTFPENDNKHIVVKEISVLSDDDFRELISANCANSKDKSALIFIHGYHNSFHDAALRCAQLTYDMPFNDNLAGFFSWASSDKTLDYLGDISRAKASIPAFIEFIKDLVDNCGVKKLHFIAHSMGNELLVNAMRDIASIPEHSTLKAAISHVVLAAPDVDQVEFSSNILPHFRQVGQSRTLYASIKDKALLVSSTLRQIARLGQGGDKLFIDDSLVSIDASNKETDLTAHSYVFELTETLNDLFYLLNEDLGPERRPLIKLTKNSINYYKFRN